MLSRKSKIVALGIICMILFTTVAFADVVEKNIKVIYTNIKIFVDGKEISPKDAIGNKVEPFVYNGTTYLPVRAIAEAFDKEVKWDGTTKSIYIGELEEVETAVYVGNGITSMNYQEGYDNNRYKEHYGGIYKDNIGNEYDSCLSIYINKQTYNKDKAWSYIEYPLNSKYDSFKATLALTEKYKSTKDTLTLEIYADDNLISTEKIKAGDMPRDIELNVKNVLKIKFKVLSTANDWSEIGLFNARFVR